jgi:hypothetical protein
VVLEAVAAAAIPTLSDWATIMLAGLFVLFGVARIRRARDVVTTAIGAVNAEPPGSSRAQLGTIGDHFA